MLSVPLLVLVGTASAGAELHRFWPGMPRPKAAMVLPFVGDHEEGMTYETAAGLAADATRRGKASRLLVEDFANSGYEKWFAGFLSVVRPRRQNVADTWEAIGRLQALGIVRGHILFRYDTNDRPWHGLGPIDESANVATALAPLVGGVAVSERFQARAEQLGLSLLLDVRDRTEEWCLATYGEQFSRQLLMTADPKSRVARSMAVAHRAFVVSRPGPVYEAALARCEPDSPVLGWGCGGEDSQTLPSSEWGLFQTATNWCHNLPAFSTETVGRTIPRERVSLPPRCRVSLRDIEWETGVHYVTFIMSDGDNVQWLMGNFAGGSEGASYYESPVRGQFPFGWTFPYVDLAQVCPYTLTDLFGRATPNDDFVLYSGGYYYPDRFGVKRGDDVLRLHARRLGEYMRFGRLHAFAVNCMDWDSDAARRAYRTYAEEMPDLDGVFTVQYYPYSGGEGRILWAEGGGRSIPVISCRLTIWANTGRPRDTTPAGVAARLNRMPTGEGVWSDEQFSFVMAHSWSWFRDTHGDPSPTAEEEGVSQDRETPGTARGLLPVKWAADRLSDHVRVVTPARLLLLARLHLRTRETLSEYARDLEARVAAARRKEAAERLGEAKRLLPTVRDGDDSGRRCFELLQRADRATVRK
jgi:GxGYxYP putative glycoside hydrolase C-terminal domain